MRKVKFIIPLLFLLILSACASQTPWRKATVTTYELLGVGVGATKDTAEVLRTQNLITEAQLAKIKDIYNKARATYIKAGEALKLAGRVVSAAERDASLAEYSKLLSDFATLSQQLYDVIKGFKKVSRNEVMELAMGGVLEKFLFSE